MTRRRVYLAGPEVFHPDAVQLGAAKLALCGRYGFDGRYPLSTDALLGSREIFRACLDMMRDCDLGIFNLTPFRGPSADVGTVFELGAMAAAGKPVFAYTNVADDLLARLRAEPGYRHDETSQCWRDPWGMAAEDFGNADNLMLDEAVAACGVPIRRCEAPHAQRFADLSAFELCLADARRHFAGEAPRAT